MRRGLGLRSIVLVGLMGAGKSTVLRLLLRFYDPQAGGIRLDGVDLRDAEPAEVRARMALVAQDSPLFSGSAPQIGRNPDLHIHVADARRYVRAAGAPYDVIVADLYHPSVDGSGALYSREHFAAMRDGAIMANSGHFDAELDLRALREMAEGHVREVRENVLEFEVGRKRIELIAEGRLVNLGAAEGHPAAVMDMSFANQALSAEYVVKHGRELEQRVYVVPEAIDAEVARLKLAALGVSLDAMTPEQAEYVASWRHGT